MEISVVALSVLLVGAAALGGISAFVYARGLARHRRVANTIGGDDAERLADIIDLATDWVWETDADHRYTYVSPRLIEHTGLPLEHWLNSTRFDTLALAHDREVAEAHIKDIMIHRPFRDLQYWIDRPTGLHCFQTSGKPKFDADGEFLGYRGTGRDITARKQAEADLERAQEELLRQERLVTLGQLTATVSHELRNPLGAIRTSAYAVRIKLADGDYSVDAAMERIERNVVRCDRIIDELLDFNSFRGAELETVKVGDWLGGVLDAQPIPAGVSVVRELQAGDAVCDIDREAMRRVVINLYDNACQAMVSMKGADSCTRRVLTVGVRRDGDCLEIEFRDTGVGIPEDVLPRLFEPMFSTKTFGIGLGLSVVRKVVELHGGHVEIANNEDTGVSAKLTLPLSRE
jgi:PAS domain S-box-containing protein